MAIVVVEGHEAGVGDRVFDTEGAGTEVTDCGVLSDRLIEFVVVAILVFEFRNPLCTGSVEDELNLVAIGSGELPGRLESVHESSDVRVAFRPGEDDTAAFAIATSSTTRESKCGLGPCSDAGVPEKIFILSTKFDGQYDRGGP